MNEAMSGGANDCTYFAQARRSGMLSCQHTPDTPYETHRRRAGEQKRDPEEGQAAQDHHLESATTALAHAHSALQSDEPQRMCAGDSLWPETPRGRPRAPPRAQTVSSSPRAEATGRDLLRRAPVRLCACALPHIESLGRRAAGRPSRHFFCSCCLNRLDNHNHRQRALHSAHDCLRFLVLTRHRAAAPPAKVFRCC